MILVADSGSSKADWILSLPDTGKLEFRTSGINPFFVTEKEAIKILHRTAAIQPYLNEVSEIYFFGAGCSSPDRREMVSNALSQVFNKAFISVESDLLASAYATCGDAAGLCCILGTGSNSCFFDGRDIETGKHGLGYILGDEGSGTHFGKKLIASYFYDTMPSELQKPFYDLYHPDKENIIKQVYQKPAPNFYLASFAKFMSGHISHPFIINLLRQGFEEFVQTNIASYANYRQYNCHFVGSIAFHFRDILHSVCRENNVTVGKILKHPVEDLYQFILSRETKNA